MTAFIKHALVKEKAVESRSYQETLAARVLEKGSSLVVAPTALGKTIIAVLVIADVLEKKKGKVLFLAPTKPLVLQHSRTLKKLMKLGESDIAVITGALKPKERAGLFNSAKIVCSTPQCTRNDLKRKRISLSGFGLCIFDEAHRAVGDYAYVPIARAFVKECPGGLVLGMTASPGHERKKIKEIAENMSINNFEIRTHEDQDVKPYVNEIGIEWRSVALPKEYASVVLLLKAYLKKQLSDLKRMGQIPTDNPKHFSRTRILDLQKRVSARIRRYGKRMPSLYGIASKIACVLMASHALLLIETQGAKALNDYFEKRLKDSRQDKASRSLKMFLKDERVKNAVVESRKLQSSGIDHSKLVELKRILKKQFSENPDSRVLVFNHYRDSVAFLTGRLSAIENVRVKAFVGQAAKGKEKGMSQKEQADILKRFEKGEFNALVATSVAEEGLDIPSCDLVVFYEPVPSEIRHIQRRGRTGRIKKGRAIILMASDTRDEAFYWSAKKKEGKMQRVLKKLQSDAPEKQKKLGDYDG